MPRTVCFCLTFSDHGIEMTVQDLAKLKRPLMDWRVGIHLYEEDDAGRVSWVMLTSNDPYYIHTAFQTWVYEASSKAVVEASASELCKHEDSEGRVLVLAPSGRWTIRSTEDLIGRRTKPAKFSVVPCVVPTLMGRVKRKAPEGEGPFTYDYCSDGFSNIFTPRKIDADSILAIAQYSTGDLKWNLFEEEDGVYCDSAFLTHTMFYAV